MKLYLICILILIFLFAICFYSTITVTKTVNTTEAKLQDVVHQYQAGNTSRAAQQIEHLIQYWMHQNNKLGMLLYHALIHDVISELYKLEAYISTDNSGEFYSTSAGIFAMLSRIREMEYPILKNIL